jgi:ABC-type transport system substrate-binding protein
VASARLGLSNQVIRLDTALPLTAPSYQALVLSGGQLFRFDRTRKSVPDLAESLQVAPDGLSARLVLKANLKYSDGTPVKADDVVFAFDRIRKGPQAYFIAPVESAQASDERTITLKLQKPYPDLQDALAYFAVIVHPRAKIEADQDYFTHPVSAGPYVIKQWTPGTPSMKLEANPHYVGGAPAIANIELVAVPDLTSRVLQVTTGQLDWAYDLPAVAKDSLPQQVAAAPHPIAGMYNVTINLSQDGPLADQKVRQALALAIDREQVNRTAFFGISKAAQAFLYTGVPEWEPILPNGGKRDLEGAKKLLAESPFAAGFDFTLQTWGSRPGWKEASLIIAGNLKELGINVTVDPIEDAVAQENLGAGKYQAQFSGNTGHPIFFLRNQFTPKTFWGDAARYNNAQVTALLDQASVESDPGKRKDLFSQVQRQALQDLPHIPICERVVLIGSRLPATTVGAVTPGELIRVGSAGGA